MKTLVIGGGEGIGKEVVDYFAPNSLNMSRRTGNDITNPISRETIAEMSLDFDAVLNHAYCGDMSQWHMLKKLYEVWRDANKKGYIFHTGSYSTYTINWNPDSSYTDLKKASDELARKISKRCENNVLPFKLTNIRPGMLDTPRSRAKPHWEGNGIRGIDFAKLMEYLYNLPWDLCVPQIILEAKHDPI